MEDVDLLLRALRLEQYAPRFEAEGWDDTDFLQSLDGQALTDLARSVGMKPGHADRFVRNASKVNFRTQAAPAHHRGPEAVTRALIALRLDMYAAQFQEQGWDDLDDLLAMQPDRLYQTGVSLGMKLGHAGKLRDQLASSCSGAEASTPPSSPRGAAPGRGAAAAFATPPARTSVLSAHTTHTMLDSPSVSSVSDSDREAPRGPSPARPWRRRTFSGAISGELESLKASLASPGAESRAQSAARQRMIIGASGAAAMLAAVCGLVAWGALRTAAERIEFSMTVRGVDFVQLSSYPSLCSEVKGKIREVVASSAVRDISPENVAVVLAAGSVVARTTVYPPPGLDVVEVQSSLDSCTTLGHDVAASIASIHGIKAVSTGPVSVSDISYISHIRAAGGPAGGDQAPPASTSTASTTAVTTTDVAPAPVPPPSTTVATTSTKASAATASTTPSTTARTTGTRRSTATVTSVTTSTPTNGQPVDTAQCGPAEANVRYIASDVYSIPEVASESECCLKCRVFPAEQGGCTVWAWESDCEGCRHTCTLMGGGEDKTPVTKVVQPGVVSGLAERAQEDDAVPFLRVPSAGPSLFCWALVLPGTYEEELLKMQHSKNLSIFGCDGWDVYSNMSITLDRGLKTRIVDSDLSCDIGGEFMTALNTEIFLAVWSQVFSDKRYLGFEWTAKVDPDTVWFPERLRARLARWHEQEEGTYLNNCRFGLHGPIEVFSRNALKAFEKDLAAGKDEARCVKEQEWELWGEDLFVDQCFIHVLNVNRVNDWALICEDHCDCPEWKGCRVKGKVAFHPFKSVNDYLGCLENAAATEGPAAPKEAVLVAG